jgi:predicted TIM-barrel fold metal-dependent hydrolase
VEDVLLGLPLYIDTSYSHYVLQNEGMTRMIKKHGAHRVLFGSDSPWMSANDEIKTILELELPYEDKEAILYRNAAELLK